jgi:hypothetical protein
LFKNKIMPLSQQKILKNSEKFFQTAFDNGFMTDELVTFLGQDFIKAPASGMKSMFNAFEGGLVDHLLRVAKYAIMINNTLPDHIKVDQKSLLKVCLLHQIGKAKMFKPCTSEWHIKNQGKIYEFNDSEVSMHVGERSVYYAMSNGITFTEEEFISILNMDKDNDKMMEYHGPVLGRLLKDGTQYAIIDEKHIVNED